MKISIITVTYNSEKTLEDTISSVLNQNYEDLEYILVDGASKDNTINIINSFQKKYPQKLKYISEKDYGIYDAMNKGIRMATGDIIGILNSDDIFNDNFVLTDIIRAFSNNIDAICGNLKFVRKNNVNSTVRVWKGSPYKSFSKGWHPAHPTFYVRKRIYDNYGVYDTSFNVSADFELMLRLIEINHINIRYLNRDIVKMRIGGESTCSLINIYKGNKNIIKAFNKNKIKVSYLYPIYRLTPKILSLIKFLILSKH